jgi:hypothetical protein
VVILQIKIALSLSKPLQQKGLTSLIEAMTQFVLIYLLKQERV